MFSKPLKVSSFIVCLLFFWTLAGGAAFANATKVAVDHKGPQRPAPTNGVGKLNALLDQVDGSLGAMMGEGDGEGMGADFEEALDSLSEIDDEILAEFAATEEKLLKAKLPKEILKRHTDFVATYNKNINDLKKNIAEVKGAKGKEAKQAAIAKAKKHLAKRKGPKKPPSFDPNNLPHRSMKPTDKKPKMKKEDFEREYGKPASKKAKPVKRVQVAAGGDYALDMLAQVISENQAAINNDGYLDETPEVQLTESIRAKAAELDHDPLKIYNWVRNNIEFAPTWGSIQGAQLCMETKQGNAFDISSLLISLLRASGIKSRYVMGTVELPIDKIMNWAGGFTDPLSALDHMASGGIPTAAHIEGDDVIGGRFEHVWVEAYVDYFPSRGARHQAGGEDTWIPLDATYKQYTYTAGLDMPSLVPFDTESFSSTLTNSAEVDDKFGSVTSLDYEYVQERLSTYQAEVKNYVEINYPDATAVTLLGDKEIVARTSLYLAGNLPYRNFIRGTDYFSLPDGLRHNVEIELSGLDSTLNYQMQMPQIARAKIVIDFVPETETDNQIVDAYHELNAESIPAYLLSMKPIIKVDNQIVSTGQATNIGETYNLKVALVAPNETRVAQHKVLAGDYYVVGLNVSRVDITTLEAVFARDYNSDPMREMLYQIAHSYWSLVDTNNELKSKVANVNSTRQPSELAVSAKVNVTSLFGSPVSATYNTRNIDVQMDIRSVSSVDGDQQKETDYMLQTGAAASAYEGMVFDLLFGKPVGDGISTVSAMKLAHEQGVPVHLINATNINEVLPALKLSKRIEEEIQSAVQAGKVVTTPSRNVLHPNGWEGAGYLIFEPETGSAAFRISGGLNGGDSKTEAAYFMETPQVTLPPVMIGILQSMIGQHGGIIVFSSTGVLEGIAIGVGAITAEALILIAAAALAIAAILAVIFKTVLENTDDGPEDWRPYRHYTTVLRSLLILGGIPPHIRASVDGDLGYGAYVTDLDIEPTTEEARAKIMKILRMTVYPETCVKLLIDRNKILLIDSPNPLYEYQYVYQDGDLIIDGESVMSVGVCSN